MHRFARERFEVITIGWLIIFILRAVDFVFLDAKSAPRNRASAVVKPLAGTPYRIRDPPTSTGP